MPKEIVGIKIITTKQPIPEDLVGITSEQLQVKVAESELKMLRQQRNARLAECDWVVARSVETGVGISSEWSQYRQSLRDITDTYQTVGDVVWPTKPE